MKKIQLTGGAGDWTRDFPHAKRTLYHWVTPPSYSTFGHMSLFENVVCISGQNCNNLQYLYYIFLFIICLHGSSKICFNIQ